MLVRLPDTPVTVTVCVPEATVLPAVKLTLLVVLVLKGLKLAVTPAGNPEADRLTLPLNPLVPVTLIISAALEPAVTVSGPVEERLKSGVSTVTAMFVEATRLPDVPVMVTV